MSGIKGRSGRKPDRVIKSVREGIDKCITPTQWRKIWRVLAASALEGNIQAARLLHAYRFGSPQPEPPPPPAAAANNHIAYLLPVRDDEVLPPDAIVVKDEELLDSTLGSPD